MALGTRHLNERHVRRQGRRDGRNWRWDPFAPGRFFRREKAPYPIHSATTLPAFEHELREIAEGQMKGLAVDWSREDKRLKPKYCDALAEYQHAIEAEKRETAEARAESTRLELARKRLEDRGVPDLDPRWMYFWLIVIGLAEYPLNSMVFQLFGEQLLLTHVFALGIAVVIPFSAHLFGSNLRKEERTSRGTWLLVVAPGIVLALLAAISFLRARFLEVGEAAQVLGISFTLTQSTVVFFVFNLAFFLVAVFVSHEGTHPEHRLYTQERRLYRAVRKAARRESSESRKAQRRLESAWRALEHVRAQRRGRYKELRAQALEVAERFETFVWVYRRANIKAREDGVHPPVFEEDPPVLAFPAGLDSELPDEVCGSREPQAARMAAVPVSRPEPGTPKEERASGPIAD